MSTTGAVLLHQLTVTCVYLIIQWFVTIDRIYSIDLEIKNITDTDRSASYIDPHLAIDNGDC
jgi:hypothetical protein